jgi:hypothetical protein
MRVILFTLFFAAFFVSIAHSQTEYAELAQESGATGLAGTIACNVRNATAIEIDEGESETYARFTDLPNKGDEILIDYSVNYYGSLQGASVSLNLYTNGGDEKDYLTQVSFFALKITDQLSDNALYLTDDQHIGRDMSMASNNYLMASNAMKQFRLRRYYKADWQGIYSEMGIFSEYNYSMVFRCQQSSDALSDFIDFTISMFE